MNNSIKQQSLFFLTCKVLYFLFPLPVAWLSLSLMSMYLKYYDMGINAGANNGFLVFFVAPALLTALYIIAVVSIYLANRFLKSQWLGIIFGSLLVLILGVGSFIAQVQSSLDYPTEKSKNMTAFLKYYAEEIGTHLTHHSDSKDLQRESKQLKLQD